MDWSLFAAVVIGIVLASVFEAKFKKPDILPVAAPPSNSEQVGYSSSNDVKTFLDNFN